MFFFFFQAEDGIRDHCVTGVQTCALPISGPRLQVFARAPGRPSKAGLMRTVKGAKRGSEAFSCAEIVAFFPKNSTPAEVAAPARRGDILGAIMERGWRRITHRLEYNHEEFQILIRVLGNELAGGRRCLRTRKAG